MTREPYTHLLFSEHNMVSLAGSPIDLDADYLYVLRSVNVFFPGLSGTFQLIGSDAGTIVHLDWAADLTSVPPILSKWMYLDTRIALRRGDVLTAIGGDGEDVYLTAFRFLLP